LFYILQIEIGAKNTRAVLIWQRISNPHAVPHS
jgi:hypothetical protein